MAVDRPNFYLNIHAVDPNAGSAFFAALGFTKIPEYSDEKTQSFRLPTPNEKMCLMIHAHSRFKEFIRPGSGISDATKSTEALFSIAVDTKEEVDEWISKAVKAGGQADPYVFPDYGASCGMYTRSFADLDGHIWEVVATLGKCTGYPGEEKTSA